MVTVGIDLAAQPANTAICAIEWTGGTPRIDLPRGGVTDDDIVEVCVGADKVGIDAPFGWPRAFVEGVGLFADTARWKDADGVSLRFRTTDRIVAATKLPLSVSTDRIGIPAMRCARLLTRLTEDGDLDRTGAGKFAEVYPAAALIRWGLDTRGYKRAGGKERRGELVPEFFSTWDVDPGPHVLERCIASDDCFDALVATVVARAVDLRLTEPPGPEHDDDARVEGWIHLPARGSLPRIR